MTLFELAICNLPSIENAVAHRSQNPSHAADDLDTAEWLKYPGGIGRAAHQGLLLGPRSCNSLFTKERVE